MTSLAKTHEVDYTELSANLFSAKRRQAFRLARASRGRGKESFSKIFSGRRKNRWIKK